MATTTTWTAISAFDDQVKEAVKDFIDTPEGGSKLPRNAAGRSKSFTFDFKCEPTPKYTENEIGTFTLVLSYPATNS